MPESVVKDSHHLVSPPPPHTHTRTCRLINRGLYAHALEICNYLNIPSAKGEVKVLRQWSLRKVRARGGQTVEEREDEGGGGGEEEMRGGKGMAEKSVTCCPLALCGSGPGREAER